MISLIKRILTTPTREINRRRWTSRSYRPNERAIEYSFALKKLFEIQPRTVLDIGPGRGCFPQLLTECGFEVTAIDSFDDYHSPRAVNNHFHVLKDDILNPKLKGPFDAITCISTLDHIIHSDIAVRNMLSMTSNLIMTFPFNRNKRIPNVYARDVDYRSDKFITQAFSQSDILTWTEIGIAVQMETWKVFSQYWAKGHRINKPSGPEDADLALVYFKKIH